MTTRTCASCGASVDVNERFCGNCGTRQPVEANVGPTQILQPPSDAPTQTLPSPSGGQTPPPPAGAYDPRATLGVPAYDGPPTPPKRSGCPIWLVVLLSIVGLCMVMVVGSIGVLTLLGQRVSEVFVTINSGLVVEETSVVPPLADLSATADAIATESAAQANDIIQSIQATAAAQATAGAAAGAAARSTAEAVQATANAQVGAAAQSAQATAAVIATQAAFLQEQQTSLQATAEAEALFAVARQVFRDEFVDNRYNWFTGRFNDQETNLIEDGVFKVQWDTGGFSYELYQVREFTNFIAQVDCVVVKGEGDGSCGIVFGQKPDKGQYEFEVFNDYYRLNLNIDGEWQTLVEGDPAGVVKPNETNRLRVVRINNEARLYINDQMVASDVDKAFPSGRIGVSTNSYRDEGGVEVWFDNFTIWELP